MTAKKENKREKTRKEADKERAAERDVRKEQDNTAEQGEADNSDDRGESQRCGEEKGEAADTMTQESRATEEKLAEMQDRYLRLSAEFDNYRKRTLKEKMELSRIASESLLLELLPVMDDIERGMTLIAESSENPSDALKEGVKLIYSKLKGFLEKNGVREIEAINREFDVDMHDAVTKIPVEDSKMKGRVVDVVQKGYTLNDRVIRFSKVVIGE